MLYPLTFEPILQPRVWGGRNLERLYHKVLPPDVRIGESWEISDRPNAVSVVSQGDRAGTTLRELMDNHAEELLGVSVPKNTPFPLLCKILDAQEKLSVQVHPPQEVAKKLNGEPKTEMWYLADAIPGAELYVGLRKGVDRPEFERRIQAGSVAESLHRIPVQAGDAIFLPSGRVHAIGAGVVIFEIQQNSDTTYRVFDWNRVGLDEKPRTLHVPESLASIDFQDHEPGLIQTRYSLSPVISTRVLVHDPLFSVDVARVKRGQRFYLRCSILQILALLRGRLIVAHGKTTLTLTPGQFCLLPACLERVSLVAERQCEYLHVQLGEGSLPSGIEK